MGPLKKLQQTLLFQSKIKTLGKLLLKNRVQIWLLHLSPTMLGQLQQVTISVATRSLCSFAAMIS